MGTMTCYLDRDGYNDNAYWSQNVVLYFDRGTAWEASIRVKRVILAYTFKHDPNNAANAIFEIDPYGTTIEYEWIHQIGGIGDTMNVEFDVPALNNLHVKIQNIRADYPGHMTITPSSYTIPWSQLTLSDTGKLPIQNATVYWLPQYSSYSDSGTFDAGNFYAPGKLEIQFPDTLTTGGAYKTVNYSWAGGTRFLAGVEIQTQGGETIQKLVAVIQTTTSYFTFNMDTYLYGYFFPTEAEGTIKFMVDWVDDKSFDYPKPRFTAEEECTVTINASAPTISNVTVSDANGYLSTYLGYVAGQSKYQLSARIATNYSATLTDLEVTVSGSGNVYSPSFSLVQTVYYGSTSIPKYYYYDISGTFVMEEPLSTDDYKITIKATDSRGKVTTSSKTQTVIDWFTPMLVNAAVHRGRYSGGTFTPDDEGGYVKIDWSVKFAPVNNRNSRQLKITAPDGQHTESLTAYEQSGYRISQASTESSFIIVLTLTDSFATFTRTISLSTAGVALDILRGGKGIGIGKVAEMEETIDFNPQWDIRVYGMTLAEYIEYVVGQMNT